MAEDRLSQVRRSARSPRSAAFAGIAYSLMMITGMVLTTNLARVRLENITPETLESWTGTASVVITLVPFAGIAFLWFTGVIRERLGEQEDQFFATIFFGSGIIEVVMLFFWGAIFGAIMVTRAITATGAIENYMVLFGFALMSEIIGNYAVRMAGVYMTAIATLWTRTGVMPRWLIFITYFLAIVFLLGAERFRETRFIFPAWVFVVSIVVLILNYRRTHDKNIAPAEQDVL